MHAHSLTSAILIQRARKILQAFWLWGGFVVVRENTCLQSPPFSRSQTVFLSSGIETVSAPFSLVAAIMELDASWNDQRILEEKYDENHDPTDISDQWPGHQDASLAGCYATAVKSGCTLFATGIEVCNTEGLLELVKDLCTWSKVFVHAHNFLMSRYKSTHIDLTHRCGGVMYT